MNRLIIFTKFPEVGKVKTRLIPKLGAEGAKQVHEELVRISMETTRHFLQSQKCDLQIFYKGVHVEKMKEWLGQQHSYREQIEGDLGDKMENAFESSFQEGYSKVMIIGTDCPYITKETLIAGFTALENNDVVWGPAEDGGYYTVGLSKMVSIIFKDIEWSTEAVLNQSKEKLRNNEHSFQLLEELHDIDFPEDYFRWKDNPNYLPR